MNRKRGSKSNVNVKTELTQPSPSMPQLNGQECFFTEATFRRVMGPELPFEQKILAMMRRIETKKKREKKKPKDLDKPNELDTEDDAPTQMETTLNIRNRTLELRDTSFDLLPDQLLESSKCTPLIWESRRESDLNNITSTDQSDSLKISETICNNLKSLVVGHVPSENGAIDTESVTGLEEAADTKMLNNSNNLDLLQHSSPSVNTNMNLNPGLIKSDLILNSQTFDVLPNTITSPAPDEKILPEDSHSDKEDVMCLVFPSLSDEEDEVDAKPSFSVSSSVLCSTERSLACDKTSKDNTEVTLLKETKVDIAPTTDNMNNNNQTFLNICQGNQARDSDQCMDGSVAQLPTMHLTHGSHNRVTEAQRWSEEDIPIFSVKVEEQKNPAMDTNNSKKFEVCHSDSKKARTDKATQENVTQMPIFKQSNLTREEHSQYMKLYKKYVGAYSQGGLPAVLGAQHMKELAVFEQLQKQVLREQAEFQDYLKKNAERNPKYYQFLREPARNYSSSRIGAYRLRKEYASLFSISLCDKISLSPGSGSAQMTYHQTLLEVGTPPLIKLPSIPKGKPPTRIPHYMKKIDALFPKFIKKKPHGFIHHDPVSCDVNAKVLVHKHNIQVVMSSSVLGCLFNNQEPSYHHAWNIPVTIQEFQSGGKISKVVYLDKPLFEDDLKNRDYNAIFHKYALRTLVSHVKRRQKKPVTIKDFEPMQNQGLSHLVDDPFDMFNSTVTHLETFGTVGTSENLSLCHHILSPSQTLKTPATEEVKEFNKSSLSKDARQLDSKDDIVVKSLDKNFSLPDKNATSVTNLVNPLCPSNVALTQSAKSPEPKSNSDKMEVTKRRSQRLMKEDLSRSSSDMATSLDKESVLKISPSKQSQLSETNTSSSIKDKSLSILPAEEDAVITESASVLSPIREDQTFLNRTRGRMCAAESVKSHSKNVHSENGLETNKNESSSLSPRDIANISSSSLDMLDPLSPTASPPSSPPPNNSHSVNQVIREIPSSPVFDGPHEMPPVCIIPLSPNMSAIGNSAKEELQSKSYHPFNRNNNPLNVKLFSPLDDVLGQTFEGNCNKIVVPKEDPADFVQPFEDCSNLHYNLWSLGDKKVLIRSSCHGIIKDHKKPRAVYLCPKMEYQTSYGLEQVTVNEMVKNWTSCYIRQNTNLLRARINAFTSEILMYEEMEPHKILQPSLNFKPQNAFQFLDSVLNHLTRLECGKYLLSHDAGVDYCGVKKKSVTSDYRTQRPHKSSRKRRAVDETIPWIPIDPTLILPLHEEKNRIPATFMPKDCVLENPGKKKNNLGHGNNRNKRSQQKKTNKRKRNKNS